MRPILCSFGGWSLRSYGVMTVAGYLAGALYLRRYRKELGLSAEQWLDLLLIGVASSLLGGKLGALIFYYRGDWQGWSTLLKGGLSVYQGFWLGTLCIWLYCRSIGKSFGPVADRFAVIMPLGHSLGRLGCFLNGCCYGKASAWPWAVRFHDARARLPDELLGIPLHPTQLYDAGGNLLIALTLHGLLSSRLYGKLRPGTVGCLYVLAYAGLRLAIEFYRADNPGRIVAGLTTAQWIALANAAAALYLIDRNRLRGYSQ